MIEADVLPYEANFIDLDSVKKDDLGVPVARVTFSIYENEKRMAVYLAAKMAAIHKAAGATKTWGGAESIYIPAVASHAYGGAKATFVSTGGYNPTETIQALAWYGSEYIAKNFGTLTA
jgi:hypothetical protein